MGCCTSSAEHDAATPSKYGAVNETAERLGLAFKDGFHEAYALGRKLGEGAAGIVFRATKIGDDSGTVYAVKKIPKASMRTQEEYQETVNEIGIMAKIDHPNIVKLLDYYHEPDAFYLVQEFMQGGELLDHILDRGRYTERDAQKYVLTLTRAMLYCHVRRIVHRDIKPENILLTSKSSGEFKLADFGFADMLSKGSMLDDMKGTPMYMAPEIERGAGYDSKVDCWSLGVVFYVLMCGHTPFPLGLDKHTLKELRKGEYRFPDKAFYDLSSQAQQFLNRVLDPNPATRLSCSEMLEHPWLRASAVDVPDVVLGKTLLGIRSMMRRTARVVLSVARMKRMSLHRIREANRVAAISAAGGEDETKSNAAAAHPSSSSGSDIGEDEEVKQYNEANATTQPAAETASTPLLNAAT